MNDNRQYAMQEDHARSVALFVALTCWQSDIAAAGRATKTDIARLGEQVQELRQQLDQQELDIRELKQKDNDDGTHQPE